ncbi:MAG TPA: alpha-E domain-containing protein [Terracidiphilus sp.]|jgi:uncharacterized alpha-E superfamily protein|nr:alpha-E domain-containing protein [Terracidiphilus sp.]
MLSRVADSLYWMSRYLERAENTVRQLDVTMSLMLDTSTANTEARWQRMVAALGKPTAMEWNGSLEDMARRLVFDSLNPASVTYCVNAARENARQVREEISTEQWQRLNRLYHQMHSPHVQAQFTSNISDALASIIDGVYLFKGTTDTTMIHGQGWQFIRLGRYLERAYSTATLLEVYQPDLFQHSAAERAGHLHLELVGLLRCCTSFEAYCQVYTADLSPDRILEFLLLNRDFPHAIRYCVDGTRQAIDGIQESGGRRPPEALLSCLGKLHAMLGYATIGEILAGDSAAFLHNIREQCLRIHDMVYRYYIHYSIQSALAV